MCNFSKSERLRQVVEETKQCYGEILAALGSDVDMNDKRQAAAVNVHLEAVRRNKRCGVAYIHERARRIETARWEVGRVFPSGMSDRLSAAEQEYNSAYSTMLEQYQKSIGFDLTTDINPPKELMVEIRVLQSCGEIYTDSGAVNLERNTTHYLRRSDIEPYIRKGFVEQIL